MRGRVGWIGVIGSKRLRRPVSRFVTVFMVEFVRNRFAIVRLAPEVSNLIGPRLWESRSVRLHRRFLAGHFFVANRFALHDVAIALALGSSVVVAASTPSRAAVCLCFGSALVMLLLREKRLPVGDGDLVVVRMDFRKRQKSVTIAAVVDEGRLQ
jgi:hypothetical protein